MSSASRDWYWLYGATAPSVRAQSIQVLNMAHAMATLGERVSLAVHPAQPGVTATDVLDFYGLQPSPTLRLTVLPGARTVASVAARAHFAAWLARAHRPVVLARSKRYAAQALDWFGERFTLIQEVHEVDSLLALEAGSDPSQARALEERVLAGASAVVANAPGTLRLLREAHTLTMPSVSLHNGTHPSRKRSPKGPGEGLGYVGSVRPYKGLHALAVAARHLSMPVTLVGAVDENPLVADLLALSGGRLRTEPPLPYCDVPDRLSRFAVLALPLADNLFGRHLTSPLKLWDALAIGRPLVAADLPSVHAAAPGAFTPYPCGDGRGLALAVERALAAPAPTSRLRSWADRARELRDFVGALP